MNIFLRRISANTKHGDISEFVTPVLNNGFFRKPGKIHNVEILALRDSRADTVEYHGLVTLDSEKSVRKAVQGLKNRRLNGRYVLVRPYFFRSWSNDPRQSHGKESRDFLEKRKGDRRRGRFLEIIKNIPDRFSNEDDFFHTLNHQQLLVTFIVPVAVEDAVAECFVRFELEQTPLAADQVLDHRITRFLTEQNGPGNQSRRFQIYATKNDVSLLVDKLRQQFTGSGIHYWVMPVIDSGAI